MIVNIVYDDRTTVFVQPLRIALRRRIGWKSSRATFAPSNRRRKPPAALGELANHFFYYYADLTIPEACDAADAAVVVGLRSSAGTPPASLQNSSMSCSPAEGSISVPAIRV